MTVPVFNVAKYILNHKEQCDLLQLIKLCYLSYGWYFAYFNKKLFEEDIEAWRYGPVIPELYYALKHVKKEKLPPNCLDSLVQDESSLSEEMQGLIDKVLQQYGEYDGVELSALTHEYGTPWYKAYKRGHQFCIPDEYIKRHYDKLRAKLKNK